MLGSLPGTAGTLWVRLVKLLLEAVWKDLAAREVLLHENFFCTRSLLHEKSTARDFGTQSVPTAPKVGEADLVRVTPEAFGKSKQASPSSSLKTRAD